VSQTSLRVALLYDVASDAADAAPDLTIGATLDAVAHALGADGHAVTRVAVAGDGTWLARLGDSDVAFNLCEGVHGDAQAEARVIAALELCGVPFTGAGSWTAALCLRKPAVNALLERAGLPVPPFAVVRSTRELAAAGVVTGFPCVVKPAAEDASIGVTQASVARDPAALAARGAEMLARWDELVVQRYVAGREINVGVLSGEALPPSEIDFSAMPAGLWPIVSYESKWSAGSAEDVGALPRCPAHVDPSLGIELRRVALAAWRAAGGDGYGRVDFRVDGEGRPWVLEVNANPDFAPDAGLARMAAAAGLSYAALVRRVLADALARAGAASLGAPASDGADGALLASGVH
jgi:D-alanine-D-alanine ligase